MKIALAQMQMSKNWDENVDKSLSLLRQAGQQKVDLIVYPEVQMSPFLLNIVIWIQTQSI